MPNWCSNTLEITGKLKVVQKLLEDIKDNDPKREEDSPISFERISPRPKEETDWYKWNIANWGTKWDATHAELVEPMDNGDGTHTAVISFDTAWGPPMPIIYGLVEHNPKLRFNFSYEEPGMGFGAELEGSGGSVTNFREFDVFGICCPYCGTWDTHQGEPNQSITCNDCNHEFWNDQLRNTVEAGKNGEQICYTLDGELIEEEENE